MTPARPLITLTTDFGERDGYAGVMKGVILGLAPAAQLVDLTHAIPPQGIAEAAFVVYTAYRHFPAHTVHLVVVGPGVGSARRPLAVRSPAGYFVAPDNGVLGYILEAETGWQAVQLTETHYWLPAPSRTFHGRDIFALVAARLAAGVPLERFGPPLADPLRRPLPAVNAQGATTILGVVLYIDRFGNIISNGRPEQVVAGRPLWSWGRRVQATLKGQTICGLRETYSAALAGERLLLVGSSGFIEIAINQGNAAAALAVSIGEPIAFSIGEQTTHE